MIVYLWQRTIQFFNEMSYDAVTFFFVLQTPSATWARVVLILGLLIDV